MLQVVNFTGYRLIRGTLLWHYQHNENSKQMLTISTCTSTEAVTQKDQLRYNVLSILLTVHGPNPIWFFLSSLKLLV